jgi:hypothetical protein
MEEILIRVREAPGLFLANTKTHLGDGPMDSGDKAAWRLLHDLQAVLFKLHSNQNWIWTTKWVQTDKQPCWHA